MSGRWLRLTDHLSTLIVIFIFFITKCRRGQLSGCRVPKEKTAPCCTLHPVPFQLICAIILIYTLLAVPATAAPYRTVLDNGLTVILEENNSAPVAAIQVWVKAGSADEDAEEAGIAHLLEHMLFKGTERRGVGDIAREIESVGGDINAWTSFDQTVYHIVVASRYLELGLDLLSDAVRNSTFDPQELEKEKMVVQEELRRGEDSPSTKLNKRVMAESYTTHPYHRPVIGFMDTVEAIDREKVLGFVRRWYVPDNMTLVVSGDFRREEILPIIKEAFKATPGKVKSGLRERSVEPQQDRLKSVIISEDVRETKLELAFHIPGLDHEDVYPLDVMSIILGGGRSSRLYRRLRMDKTLVRSVSTYSMTPKDPGIFFIFADLKAEDLKATLGEIVEELEELKEEGVTEEELKRAKLNLESDFVYQRETIQGRARQLGYYETTAGDLSFEEKYLKGINDVTSDDIQRVVSRYFVYPNMTQGILVPEKERENLDEEGLKEVATLLEKRPGAEGEIIRKVLDNGIVLLVKENHTNPTVSLYSVFSGALLREDEENNGITNAIARMLTKGTKERSAEDIAGEIESMAGGLSGFSGRNTFGVSAHFLSRFFGQGMEIFSDVLLNPSFDKEEFKKVRKDILTDIETEEDNLARVTFKLLDKTLYKKHPYRMNTLGTKKTISKLANRDLIRYYRSYAVPQNMVIAIVGDIDAEEVEAKVKELFMKMEKGDTLDLDIPQEIKTKEIREVERIKEKEQAHIAIGFLGPSLTNPDRYPVSVLSNVLATQGGRLFMELRDKQGLAYIVTAFSRGGIGTGAFIVYMATSPENLEKSIKGIKEILQEIVDKGITEEELKKAGGHLIGSYEIGLQDNSSQASDMALNEILGLGFDEFRRYPEKIKSVTLEDVHRVAKEYIDLEAYSIVIVKP
ncbi:MAG: M16 family metallopeptidase [Thermodesulfobacteriota bacterium]